eukprot:9430687-Alexandrium_andersonii.AAC.1
MFVDITLMLLERGWHAEHEGTLWMWADASKQAGRDYLISMYRFICDEHLLECFDLSLIHI